MISLKQCNGSCNVISHNMMKLCNDEIIHVMDVVSIQMTHTIRINLPVNPDDKKSNI